MFQHLSASLPSARSLVSRLLPFVLCLSAAGVAAQGSLDPVVVTGSREPEVLARSTSDIVVIDSKTIRNSSADSVEDLIRREAGMQLIRNGGPGQNSGFFIRGASTNSTVVLVDGVRIGSASLGQAEFEALSLAQIERIEVLRGPASSLYGADAVGGVVQIFTRRGEGPPRLNGSAALGGYGSRQGDLGVSGSAGQFDYAGSIGRESSNGVSVLRPGDQFGSFNPDRDGYTRSFGNVRLGYTPAAGHRVGVTLLETRLNSQFDSAEFDADFNSDPSPDFRNHLTTRLVSADYRGTLASFWTTTLQLSRSVDDLRSGGTTLDRFITRREQATWQNALRIDSDQQLVLAYEHLSDQASAAALASEPKRRNDAGVLGYSGRVGAHSVQADARLDHNSAYGSHATARLGYAFEAGAGVKLRALAGSSFRAPTFNDLYFNDPVFGPFGVATVRPEHGRSLELGAAWQSGDSRASVTLYRNRVHDLIAAESNVDADGNSLGLCPPGYPFGCARNIGRARLQGASFTAARRWGALALSGNVELLDARNTDTGQRLARRAAHQESIAADYAVGSWTVGASALGVGSRPDSGVVLGGYGTVDLRTTWRFQPQWRLEAKLLNSLDHRIEPVRDYQGLGRQAWLGVRYDGAGL
ncbi:MAG: TonB-dependent receptor [Caldimonas sp.]